MLHIFTLDAACQLAYRYHAPQIRKGDGTPYFIHPIMVAMILATYGFDDQTLMAAICHDLLEDTDCTQEEISSTCSKKVLSLVLCVTQDPTLSDQVQWELKKQKYREKLMHAPEEAVAISCADKIHNLTMLQQALITEGEDVWSRFNRGKEIKHNEEMANLALFRERLIHPMVDAYELLINAVYHPA